MEVLQTEPCRAGWPVLVVVGLSVTAVDIRLTAVANQDQSTLAKLAMQDKNKNIRIAAGRGLQTKPC